MGTDHLVLAAVTGMVLPKAGKGARCLFCPGQICSYFILSLFLPFLSFSLDVCLFSNESKKGCGFGRGGGPGRTESLLECIVR